MTYDRLFYVSLLHSPEDADETKAYNTLRTADVVYCGFAHDAAGMFLAQHFNAEQHYRARDENPYTDDAGRLWDCWSCANDVSGQRLYIKEQIGGFDAKTLTPAEWRKNK